MKTWVIVLLVIIFVFVIVPLIYFAIIAKTVRSSVHDLSTSDCDYNLKLAKPPVGQEWVCKDGNWVLINQK